MSVVLIIYAALALAYWLFMAYGAIRLNGLPRLSRLGAPEPARWPKVSVVVPGCNEADKVEAAARTLLAEDYPDLEIILVDDRSTDDTGAVMDRVAAGDPRARVIHIKELPAGWLGKVHALDTGLKASSGEFVLFTDADVHFEPGTIRLAVAHCVAANVDHLSALPNLYPTNVLLDAAISATIRQVMVFVRAWAVSDPKSRAYAGIGAFNLVRRVAFDDTPGFEWLRLETGDDIGLGLLMKRHGKSSMVVTAFDRVALHWYRSFREAAHGSEKGWASALRFSLVRSAFSAIFALAVELAPVLLPLLLLGGPVFAGFLGIAVLGLYLIASAAIWNWVGGRPWPHLLSALTAPILVALLVRCAWLGWRRGGVLWRGTLYPDEALRPGQRVKFP
jgi:glycosyltransferase involved in cell wall biosynthesis